jgi:hypothetical protein
LAYAHAFPNGIAVQPWAHPELAQSATFGHSLLLLLMASMAHKCQWAMPTWRRRFLAFWLFGHFVANDGNVRRNIVVAVVVVVDLDIGDFLCCMWNHGDCYCNSSAADGCVFVYVVVVVGE